MTGAWRIRPSTPHHIAPAAIIARPDASHCSHEIAR